MTKSFLEEFGRLRVGILQSLRHSSAVALLIASIPLAVNAESETASLLTSTSGNVPNSPSIDGSISSIETLPGLNSESQQREQPTSNIGISDDQTYVLGAGDIVYMEIFMLADYSREYSVAADGTLTFPLIGTVKAQDVTLAALTAEVSQSYADYIRRPVITFELREARPLQIAVIGEVKRPGTYTVAMGERQEGGGMSPPTVTQVLQTAGGITQFADIRNIEIYRSTGTSKAQERVAKVSLWDLLQRGDLGADVALQDGDSLVIPTSTSIDPTEVTEVASASFSPDVMNVYVVGEVDDPGLVEVPPNTPLNQALLAAGSFSERAQTGSVELVRLNADGTVVQRSIEVDLASGISEENNPLLQPNDTVVVSRSGLSRFSDVAGNVLPPLNLLINLFRVFGNE